MTGNRQNRELLELNIPKVVDTLKHTAKANCEHPLLRIYWYDAMRLGRPTPEQLALAHANDVKIRLGQINSAGEQKGVDALIITDLAELARNHAIADAVLVSGDEDVRVGVVLAQQFGVRVHLVGIHPARSNQSPSLMQEADTTIEWDASVVREFLAYAPASAAVAMGAATANTALDALIEPLVLTLSPADLASLKVLFADSGQVPPEQDRALLRIGRLHYGQASLSGLERSTLRGNFVRLVLAR